MARSAGRRWKKGQSGNPSGRPKVVAEVRDLARKHIPEMIRLLAQIARDPEEDSRARVAAMREILDRGCGKPVQPVEGGDPDQPMRIKLVWEDVGLHGDSP